MGNKSEYLYLTDPRISSFIDILTEYTYNTFSINFFEGYKREFIKDVIKRFWITGTVIFSYPYSSLSGNKPILYDPTFLNITASSSSSALKIIAHGEDISKDVIALFHIMDKQSFQGTSIIDEGNRILSFKVNAFETACLEAKDMCDQKEEKLLKEIV